MSLNENQSIEPNEKVTHGDFAAQLNRKFRVLQESNQFEVELIEVSELKLYPRQESFSLLFKMPLDFVTQQGNYLFDNEKVGSIEIFVVPIEAESDGIIFEAIFNRLIPRS